MIHAKWNASQILSNMSVWGKDQRKHSESSSPFKKQTNLKALDKTKQTGQIFSLPMEPGANSLMLPIGLRADTWCMSPYIELQWAAAFSWTLAKSIKRTEKPLMPLCSPIMTKCPVLIKQLLLQHQYCSSHCWQACSNFLLLSQLRPGRNKERKSDVISLSTYLGVMIPLPLLYRNP